MLQMLQHMSFYIQKEVFGLTEGLVVIHKERCLPYGEPFPFQTAKNANSFSAFILVKFLGSLGLTLCIAGAPYSPFVQFVLSERRC